MRRLIPIVAALLLATGLSAFSLAQSGEEAETARRATTLATVGERVITLGEMEDYIATGGAYMVERYRDPAARRALLRQRVEAELLAMEAERRGYGERYAVAHRVKEHAVETMIRVDFDEELTPASIPAADVRAFFDEHVEELGRPEIVRAAHILLPDRESAEALMDEARAGDVAAFRQLARDRSVDTETKHRGGDLRYFTREGRPPGGRDAPVDPTLVEAAFALTEVGGVVAEPIPLGESFSILKLTGRRDAEPADFDALEPELRARLWRERRRESLDTLMNQLRAGTEIRRQPALLDTIEIPGPPSALPPAAE